MLQMVSEAARIDPALQLTTDQLNKLSIGKGAMKNYKYAEQDKTENSITAIRSNQIEFEEKIRQTIRSCGNIFPLVSAMLQQTSNG
jgi:hypothetical protein